jgi:hypothetical protein
VLLFLRTLLLHLQRKRGTPPICVDGGPIVEIEAAITSCLRLFSRLTRFLVAANMTYTYVGKISNVGLLPNSASIIENDLLSFHAPK